MSLSCRMVSMVSMVLYFYYMPIIIYILYYLVFKILSSFVRDSSYHDMYYKGCGLLCAHKKSFNTAIQVRSLVVERISCHFWPNCALFDKITKIGTEVV